jgi:hypothetical protein
MAVAGCCACGKLISLSVIPGGNPVAKEIGWATSWVACPDCARARCGACAALDPRCPDCPGPPKPPSEESRLRKLKGRCNANAFTTIEMIMEAWDFTSRRPASSSIADRVLLLKEKLPNDRFVTLQKAASQCYEPGMMGLYMRQFPDIDDLSEENFIPPEFIMALAGKSEDATPPTPST